MVDAGVWPAAGVVHRPELAQARAHLEHVGPPPHVAPPRADGLVGGSPGSAPQGRGSRRPRGRAMGHCMVRHRPPGPAPAAAASSTPRSSPPRSPTGASCAALRRACEPAAAPMADAARPRAPATEERAPAQLAPAPEGWTAQVCAQAGRRARESAPAPRQEADSPPGRSPALATRAPGERTAVWPRSTPRARKTQRSPRGPTPLCG